MAQPLREFTQFFWLNVARAPEWWKVATTRDDQRSARLMIYWSGATWRHTTRGIRPRTGSCKVENVHSWPLRFLNHGTRRRARKRKRTTQNIAMNHCLKKCTDWAIRQMVILQHSSHITCSRALILC